MYPQKHILVLFPGRLLMLAGMGLAALFMLHLLAQDFNRIRKPVANLARFLISKRDVHSIVKAKNEIDHFEIDWNRILRNDPLNCAMSLLCQIAAGAENENEEAQNMNALVLYSIKNGAPESIENVYKLGKTNYGQFSRCYRHYPYCPYSAKTMLKILQIHAYIFGER